MSGLKCVAAAALALVNSVSAFTPQFGHGVAVAPHTQAPARTPTRVFQQAGTALLEGRGDVLADLEELDRALGDDEFEESSAPKPPSANRVAMNEAKAKWQRAATDGGSPEVQIAMLTVRVQYLTQHVLNNPQDVHSRRGLFGLVATRKRQLQYLHRQDAAKCQEICKTLGVRFKPKGAKGAQLREDKYRAYPNTKSDVGKQIAARIQNAALQEALAAKGPEEATVGGKKRMSRTKAQRLGITDY